MYNRNCDSRNKTDNTGETMDNRTASSTSESMRQQYTPMSIDYSSPHTTSNGGDHEYSSLHDMVAVDVNSNVETLYPPMDVPVGKPDVSSSTSDLFPSNSVHSPTTQLPPISSAQQNIDLDSSVSNLSWLHSLQQQMPAESTSNLNLMVNPSTATPISNPQSVRVVTLPSNVHISNSGNIKYVTVPTTKQQVYISTTKSAMSSQLYSSNRSSIGYQRNYSHSPGSVPSSTVPDNPFPKPAYSYSCLIALSLKNSRRGSLPVAEIYNFMMQNFPYFKTAPDGWKNSVRHNLSLNKCFEKIENPNSDGTHSRKGCLWAMNPSKIKKMDEEIAKWNKKDMIAIKRSMSNPELLDTLTKGQGAYLMDRTRSLRHSYQTSHLSHRPGVRIVTAIHPPNTTNSTGHQHVTIGQGQILDRQQYAEQIDLNKLADDAADLFGEHDDFVLDPSLSEFALQNGSMEDFSSDLLDLPPLHHTSPMTSPMKASQMYNSNSTIMPIY